MRKKFYIFLLNKAINHMEEGYYEVKAKTFEGKDKEKLLWIIIKALLIMSPILMERLLIALPKFFLRQIFPKIKTINTPLNLFWLSISGFFYSSKSQKEVFEPIAVDWQEEYFEALFKKEIWKARWINVRYTYAFLAAMWMKSPIGDLIEFVIKIVKIAKP